MKCTVYAIIMYLDIECHPASCRPSLVIIIKVKLNVSGFWWNVAPDRCHENPTTAAIVITGKANRHADTHKLVYKLNKLKTCICDGIKCG